MNKTLDSLAELGYFACALVCYPLREQGRLANFKKQVAFTGMGSTQSEANRHCS
jgi:hypothetical protein